MKYDEIFDSMTSEDFDGFMKTLSKDDILDYRASRDIPLAEDAASEGFQAYKRKLSGKTQYEFKDSILKKLEDYYQDRVKAYEDAIKSAKGEKSITAANVIALKDAEQKLYDIGEQLRPSVNMPYTEMTVYQKYNLGKQIDPSLNYLNEEDAKKLDDKFKKLQKQAEIKREQSEYETKSPWLSLGKDMLFPASQNARRRGEEPTATDKLLDAANIASTFVPILGPVFKASTAAKIASKLAPRAARLVTSPVTDVLANTATTTAIDARNQKAEGEEFGKFTPEQFAKNFGTAVAGTALSGLATRKSIPELAKTKVDPYLPNTSKWLESKLVNPAEAVRDEMLRKHGNITSSLAKAPTGKFYPQEVKDILKKPYADLTSSDRKKLFEYRHYR